MNENESNNLNKVNLDKNSDVSEVKNPINEISVPENSEVEISVQENPEIENSVQENPEIENSVQENPEIEISVQENPEIENSVQENTENDEISLEGRQNRLEEKIKELDALPENPISTEGYDKKAQKGGTPLASRLYLIISACIIAFFIGAFAWECTRTYREYGMFGGDIERFVDTDYDFFSRKNSDTDSSTEADTDYFEHFLSDTDIDTEEQSENSVKKAPDTDTIVNKASATLVGKDQPKDIDSPNYTARKVYKKLENSVVGIVEYSSKSVVGQDSYRVGTGSGIIVSKDGYIITNSHVIDDSLDTGAEVVLNDGSRYAASTVGFDSRTDIAVLKIDAEGLIPVEFVDSSQVEIGQDAIVIGSPGGLAYSNSLTKGCVSALDRTVKTNTIVSYIQTDAAINPGNSGGPLLNGAGQVMGIVTVKIANTDYEGMGFAIPSNTVIEVANSIIGNGYVSGRVKIGVTARMYSGGISAGIYGIEIIKISDDSPLKSTEVKVGDVITNVDGDEISTFAELYTKLGTYSPGDKAELTIYRPPTPGDAGKTFKVTIEVIEDKGQTEH